MSLLPCSDRPCSGPTEESRRVLVDGTVLVLHAERRAATGSRRERMLSESLD